MNAGECYRWFQLEVFEAIYLRVKFGSNGWGVSLYRPSARVARCSSKNRMNKLIPNGLYRLEGNTLMTFLWFYISLALVKSQPVQALGAHSSLQLLIDTMKCRIPKSFKYPPSTLVAVSATHWYLFVWYHLIREAPQNTTGAWINSSTL